MKIGAVFEDYCEGEHGRKTLTVVGGRGVMAIDMLLEGDRGDRVALSRNGWLRRRAPYGTMGSETYRRCSSSRYPRSFSACSATTCSLGSGKDVNRSPSG